MGGRTTSVWFPLVKYALAGFSLSRDEHRGAASGVLLVLMIVELGAAIGAATDNGTVTDASPQAEAFGCKCGFQRKSGVYNTDKTNEDRSVRTGQSELANRRQDLALPKFNQLVRRQSRGTRRSAS